MSPERNGPVEEILARLAQLRFKNLFLLTATLLLIDLVIPDFIPFVDEILLGLLTMLFWSWRRPSDKRRAIDADFRDEN